MYNSDFTDLIDIAYSESEKMSNEAMSDGNPYYMGFGNPNAKVLILGKEKGFDPSNRKQFEYESINNPKEWKHYTDNKIELNKIKFYGDENPYTNAFLPYLHKNKGGHTWTKYENILKYLYPAITGSENDFFNYVFMSEINYQPSKLSKINKFVHAERIKLLGHNFFKAFPATILGCGDYLSSKQIESIFDVHYAEDLSKPRCKMIVYKGDNRILVQTRQLSFDLNNRYLSNIADQLRNYL